MAGHTKSCKRYNAKHKASEAFRLQLCFEGFQHVNLVQTAKASRVCNCDSLSEIFSKRRKSSKSKRNLSKKAELQMRKVSFMEKYHEQFAPTRHKVYEDGNKTQVRRSKRNVQPSHISKRRQFKNVRGFGPYSRSKEQSKKSKVILDKATETGKGKAFRKWRARKRKGSDLAMVLEKDISSSEFPLKAESDKRQQEVKFNDNVYVPCFVTDYNSLLQRSDKS